MIVENKRIILVFLFIFSGLHVASAQREPGGDLNDKKSLVKFIRTLQSPLERESKHEKTVAFFLRFIDFGCAVCLNNFLDLCDSLETTSMRFGRKPIVLIFQRDANQESDQMSTMRKWSHASNLHYPIYLASAEFFVHHEINYSSVILVDNNENVAFFQSIPLSIDKQRTLIQTLFQSTK